MTDKLRVYVGGAFAGILARLDSGYRFRYRADYEGPPVFLNLPLRLEEKTWEDFPPPFDGLRPEGVLLDQLLVAGKLDRSDKWGQLTAVGRDLTGFLAVLPDGADPEPSVSWRVAEKRKARTRIQPGDGALPYNWSDLVTFHSREVPKMSLSGVQPKVSAVFSRKQREFQMVAERGSYILKPGPQAYPEAPINEALSMMLARDAGIDVPHCGLAWTRDRYPVFWIERFDRQGPANRTRLRVEDACQLLEVPSSWKYLGNLETLVRVVREFASNPTLQSALLFDRVLFNWVIGNGDMHLKNWSLIENGPLIELAPAYDFLNTVLLVDDEEESALELSDRKSGFDRELLLEAFGRELCGLQPARIERSLRRLKQVDWAGRIKACALSESLKTVYLDLVKNRMEMFSGDFH
ncbi:MAG: type II toxin-antitoxin system HipA family toxin [Kiritimatiellae bacterium]|nr:type II toxin-antitoxin system HipA family toxin [Kiritimatiellia bacterium]